MISYLFDKARNNPDYTAAVLTGNAVIGFNILLHAILVPLYLTNLGKFQFGVLMVLISLINFATVGVYGLSANLSRIFGEHAALKDEAGFSRGYALAKFIFNGYALVVAIVILAIGLGSETLLFGEIPLEYRQTVRLATLTAAAYFIVFLNFGIERVALAAMRRQAAVNWFHLLSFVLFGMSVVPWLLMGGGLVGVLVCLIGGTLAGQIGCLIYWRRIGVKLSWIRPVAEAWPFVTRVMGRRGAGYFLYGVIFLALQADVLIVGLLGGAQLAAKFVLVWKVAEVLILVLWRVPEHLYVELVHMDSRGEHKRIERVYREGIWWMRGAAFAIGVAYAVLGPWIVRLWVGAEYAPDDPIAYVLAGAAIFWMGSARLPAVFAHALLKLRGLVTVSGIEVIGKLTLTLVLFPKFGYLAPLIAISAVHIAGIAYAYTTLARGSA